MMVFETGSERSAPKRHERNSHRTYAGIDVSLKESSVCVVDAKGEVVLEVKVASEPEAVARYFDELELPVCRIRLEAGPLSQRPWRP